MKRLFLFILTALVLQVAQAAGMDTIIVRVKAMRCAECGHKVKNALRKNPGVGALEFNYERRTVKIAYDPQHCRHQALSAVGLQPDGGDPPWIRPAH